MGKVRVGGLEGRESKSGVEQGRESRLGRVGVRRVTVLPPFLGHRLRLPNIIFSMSP